MKPSKTYITFSVFNYILMFLLALVIILPYLNILAKAFNESTDTLRGGLTFYPRVFTFDNIIAVFMNKSMVTNLTTTLMRTLIGTFLALVVQFSAAYALTKKNLPGRSAILIYLTVPMFFTGGIVANYILFSNLGILNNFMVYVLPTAFNFFNMIVIRTFIYTIPESLKESARIDGANEYLIILIIILPLCAPILATISLWAAVEHWNDWTTTLYYVTNTKLYTLQFSLMKIVRESESVKEAMQMAIQRGQNLDNFKVPATPESMRSAQIIITTLPIIMVYPFLQKYFIKGVVIGAVKE